MKPPLPRWGQMIAGGVLLGAAVAAGGVSMALNISHGAETGAATAITFGLADVGKITIPVVAAAIGWTPQTRLTLAACAAVSLMCAASYYADTAGRLLLAREGQATAYRGAQADMARTRAELAAIAETGNAASLETSARLASDRATAEGANGGCARRCLDAQAEAARLTERGGLAKRRDELTGALAKAKAEAAASGPAEASGLATLAAMATGAKPEAAARWINAGKAGLSITLLETLVYLSIPGAALLARAMRRDEHTPGVAVIAAPPMRADADAPPEVALAPEPVVKKPRQPKVESAIAKRDTPATEQPGRAMAIVELKSQGLSTQEISDRLQVSKSTVLRTLKNVRTVNFGDAS